MRRTIFTLLTVVLIGISGCALKTPTFGDQMLAEGESRIKVAELWEQGKNESKEGEKKVMKGRKLVEKGRLDLREGEQLIASGNVVVQTNRQAYQGVSQTSEGIYSADVASDRVAKLKKIAKAWGNGEEKIKEGNELIHRGKTRIDEGELEIRKGHRLIESGRSNMQDAESRYGPSPK